MPDKSFVDTNILVYSIAAAGDDSSKAAVARGLLQQGGACISTQILGEFYNATVSTRRASPLTHEEAVVWVQFWKKFEVFEITTAHVDLALEIAGKFKISYYDALIISAARLGECELVYSEDLSDGQDYGGVGVENPF